MNCSGLKEKELKLELSNANSMFMQKNTHISMRKTDLPYSEIEEVKARLAGLEAVK